MSMMNMPFENILNNVAAHIFLAEFQGKQQ